MEDDSVLVFHYFIFCYQSALSRLQDRKNRGGISGMMFIGKKGEPTEIDIHLIRPNPDQPRKQFEQDELDELCDSIREFGIIQP